MFLPEIFNLGKAFQQYFEIVPAYTDALKEEVYRLRHQVYCEELKWEAVRPDRREHDEYDPHSLHVLIRSVKVGEFMGCTRLVLSRPEDPGYSLPFERACAATLDRSVVDPARLPRATIGEFGRLAVLRRFRNRKGEGNSATGMIQTFNTLTRPRFPYILAGLYLGTIELARLHNVDTLFILTEPRLVAHLRRLGVKIKTIGGPIEHRGQRIPSMLSVSDIIGNLGFIVRPLYQTVAAEIARGQADSSPMRQRKAQPDSTGSKATAG
jgi:N-acyl amino acid synthase of PEP-CTERM/exosortase system